jgi:hypothetical protein
VYRRGGNRLLESALFAKNPSKEGMGDGFWKSGNTNSLAAVLAFETLVRNVPSVSS